MAETGAWAEWHKWLRFSRLYLEEEANDGTMWRSHSCLRGRPNALTHESSVNTSKAAIRERLKSGHTEPSGPGRSDYLICWFFFKAFLSLDRQLRGPHLRIWPW